MAAICGSTQSIRQYSKEIKMKYRVLRQVRGSGRIHRPGEVIELSAEDARQAINFGFVAADLIQDPKPVEKLEAKIRARESKESKQEAIAE
jgi:hypothetical protein